LYNKNGRRAVLADCNTPANTPPLRLRLRVRLRVRLRLRLPPVCANPHPPPLSLKRLVCTLRDLRQKLRLRPEASLHPEACLQDDALFPLQ
jgi:hypothetical protein